MEVVLYKTLILGIHRFVYLFCYICGVPRYHTYHTLNRVRIICDGLTIYLNMDSVLTIPDFLLVLEERDGE